MNVEKTVLEISNLTKTYADQNASTHVLENVSLKIREKEFVCILGPSGCGKTTLLRCIAGFESYEGQILVEGEPKFRPGIDRIMVFQDFNQLFPWKTVEKNIQYPLRLQGIKDKKTLAEISYMALKKVKLLEYKAYYPFQLSGGMKQRVAVAKALALKAKIILMDEPFAALDAMSRWDLQNELLKIAETENSTFIFVTHNIQEAIILGSRIMVFQKGGEAVYDEKNPILKPAGPASDGYGELWERLKKALYCEAPVKTERELVL